MNNNEPIIYDGNPSNPVAMTAYGFYDAEVDFQADAPRVANFVATRLGYPIIDVELTDENIYTCFEQAITEYSSQVNQFNARENMMTLQGMPTSSIVTQKNIVGSPLPQLIKIAAGYGTEAESGGNTDMKRGYLTCNSGSQVYDMQALWANVSESGKRLEIRRVYHHLTPAIARYYDPFATTGLGLTNLMNEFGFGNYSPPVTFVMMPAYEDLLRIQAIEINDMIRKSQYSFQIMNNKIRFSPIFHSETVVWFDYMVVEDKSAGQLESGSSTTIADYSNIPYTNIAYGTINSIGRMWIYKYTLAIAKETLGLIRSKYIDIPLPDHEIKLDGELLRREAAIEKEELIMELRETLEQTGLSSQMKKAAENAMNMSTIMNYIPNVIYIG